MNSTSPTSTAERERRSHSLRLRRALCVFLAGLVPLLTLRVVVTRSIPRGLYLLAPLTTPREGDYVTFCPPPAIGVALLRHHLSEPGQCPPGVLTFAKEVVAIGPYACATLSGVLVNGVLLPWPVIPPAVAVDLPRFAECGQMPPDCVFLRGASRDSIDSRTFGCIPRAGLVHRILPLWTETSR